MNARLRQLAGALLLPFLLPVQLASMLFHFRAGRLRAARASGDRGAISIELALAVIALMVIAGGVIFAIKALATDVTSKVPKTDPVP
ncbi:MULTISPECIES: hypothetical protein [Streptomycetaceae]|uniref:Uncharacterized protein n=1 Tax=Kitasatospora indigofera TaxID=67307 RepID=A0A919KM44_9ACTN|nr:MULTISPECIES: hypothetical protein [Streptomycetaceae]OKI31035.1 hypothetical protein A6A07_03070 [Streptomyces sp. CB03911]GHH63454.1 hypothetical protein GCM10018781_12910 [Kitasatospora indigofera]